MPTVEIRGRRTAVLNLREEDVAIWGLEDCVRAGVLVVKFLQRHSKLLRDIAHHSVGYVAIRSDIAFQQTPDRDTQPVGDFHKAFLVEHSHRVRDAWIEIEPPLANRVRQRRSVCGENPPSFRY